MLVFVFTCVVTFTSVLYFFLWLWVSFHSSLLVSFLREALAGSEPLYLSFI